MRKILRITDVTFMRGDEVCVAGIDVRGNCVRPVMTRGVRRHHLFQGGEVLIRPRGRIQFDFCAADVKAPHIEDEMCVPGNMISRGICSDLEWERVLRNSSFPSLAAVFDGTFNRIDTYCLVRRPARLAQSLG